MTDRKPNGRYQSKLTEDDIILIRECETERQHLKDAIKELDRDYKERRAKLRSQIRELSGESLAKKFGVSKETVRESWYRVLS